MLLSNNNNLNNINNNKSEGEEEKNNLKHNLQNLNNVNVNSSCITSSSNSKLFSSEEGNYLVVKDFSLWIDAGSIVNNQKILLDSVNLELKKNTILGIIGPSGAGNSLLLSSIAKGIFETNISNPYKCNGEIIYSGTELLSTSFPVELLSNSMGWISQLPTLFPLTISENILFALSASGLHDSNYLEKKLENILIECGLWEELNESLDTYPQDTLSAGQAQSLCIASALILEPEILLLDEPPSALDPASTSNIEQLILKLSNNITVIIVSHSMSQINHVADYTVFINNGSVIESGETPILFTSPNTNELNQFISGKY